MTTVITSTIVKTLLEKYTAASKEGDARKVSNLYALHGKIISSGRTWAFGREDILAELSEEYAHPEYKAPSVKTEKIEIDAGGRFAFVDETFIESDGSTGSVRILLELVNGMLFIKEEWVIKT